MKRMKILVGLLVCGIVVTSFADGNKQTYRDAQGRNMGSVSTDRYGKTTYRDSIGRNQGSSSTDRYGKTTYRASVMRYAENLNCRQCKGAGSNEGRQPDNVG